MTDEADTIQIETKKWVSPRIPIEMKEIDFEDPHQVYLGRSDKPLVALGTPGIGLAFVSGLIQNSGPRTSVSLATFESE